MLIIQRERGNRHNLDDGGFTLIEMLVAIILMALLASVIFPLFSESLHFSESDSTRARMQELVKGLKVAYAKDAMVIDTTGANGGIVFTATWNQVLGTSNGGTNILNNGSVTITPTQAYTPGNPSSIQSGFYAIAGAAGNSPVHLATDGYGQPIWVYVSPEMEGTYQGYPVYYHDVAFVSTNGAPSSVTPQSQGVSYTCTVNQNTGQNGCSLLLGNTPQTGGDDIAVAFSGYAVEASLYKETLDNMAKVADAYGAYFTTQYLANTQRNVDIDYFANQDSNDNANNGNSLMNSNSTIPNTGDGNSYNGVTTPAWTFPGQIPNQNDTQNTSYASNVTNDTTPADWDSGAFIKTLGLSASTVTSAWGYLMGIGNGPNTPQYGGTVDRDPLSSDPNLDSPPYTAFVMAWAPGEVLLSKSVVGAY